MISSSTVSGDSNVLNSKSVLPFGGNSVLLADDSEHGLALIVRGNTFEDVGRLMNGLKSSGVAWDSNIENTRSLSNKHKGPPSADITQPVVLHVHDKTMFKSETKIPQLLKWCYPAMDRVMDDHIFADSALLVSKACDMDAINEVGITIMKSADATHPNCMELRGEDTVDEAFGGSRCVISSGQFCNASMPPQVLKLKIGCPVILLKAVDEKDGFMVGARCIVTRCTGLLITLKIATGPHKGKTMPCPRMEFRSPRGAFPIEFVRRQFPVKLAFAIQLS